MKNIKFGLFFLGLSLAVGGAVSVAAQGRAVQVEPRGQAEVMVLGGGSQLGVRVSDSQAGVRVDEVTPGSAAEKAGVRSGDVVVEFDGERVRSARQLTRLVQETPDGRTVKMAVMRDGQKQTLDATPESREFSFNFDRDRMRDDIERGMRGFRVEPPLFFYNEREPRRFEFRAPERTSRGRLGVSVQSLTPDLEEYFGAKNGGALVSSVTPDSAAAKAGVKAGDVITAINGRSVRDSDDLMREIGNATGQVTLTLLRDRKELTLKATLTGRSTGA